MKGSGLEDFLARSEIFRRLDAHGRERLERIATEISLEPGSVVVRQGDPGDAFFAILSGTISVTADDFGEEKEVAKLSAGTVCGEIAALTREPRTATLTAATEARLLRFEIAAVFAVLKDYPQVLADLKRLGVSRSEALVEQGL